MRNRRLTMIIAGALAFFVAFLISLRSAPAQAQTPASAQQYCADCTTPGQ